MSDRPCNLEMWRRRQREYGDRVTIDKPEGKRDVRMYRDGHHAATFARLPAESECAAFGGECEC